MHFIAKRIWSVGLFCLFDIVTVVKRLCCHPEGQTFLYASGSQKPQSEQRALSLAAWCVRQYSVVPPWVTDWSWHENKVPVGGRGGSQHLARAIGMLFFFLSFLSDCSQGGTNSDWWQTFSREPRPASFMSWSPWLNEWFLVDTACDRVHVTRQVLSSDSGVGAPIKPEESKESPRISSSCCPRCCHTRQKVGTLARAPSLPPQPLLWLRSPFVFRSELFFLSSFLN